MSIRETYRPMEETIDHLKVEVKGEVLEAKDALYDETRAVWNGLFDRRPRVIVVCQDANDVVNGIRFAREYDLPVSVRGGGHHLAGQAVCDDGVMIDLSRMRSVSVDEAARTVKVQGGATAGDVIDATQPYGLAVPTGNAAPVGIGGLTLGGGVGYLRRKYGLTCDNLIGIDLVTAEGDLVHASAVENPDLFWGVRGGGGNFGIAVEFEFRLHKIGPTVMGIHVVYAASDMARVAHGCVEFLKGASRDISVNMDCVTMLPEPFAPPHLAGKQIVMLTGIHAGDDLEQAARDIEPLRSLATPLADLSGPTDYTSLHHMLDALIHKGKPAYAQSLYVGELSEDILHVIETAAAQASPKGMLMVWPLGGAVGGKVTDVAATDTAFGDRGASCLVTFDATGDLEESLELDIAWVQEAYGALQPFAYNGGTYLNLAGLETHLSEVTTRTYGDNYARLSQLKGQYDPLNVFQFNVNIVPDVH